MVSIAGCLGAETGTLFVSLSLSDTEDADDLEELSITFDEAIARPVEGQEADTQPDPVEAELDSVTVELSDLVDGGSDPLFDLDIEAQEYQALELHVSNAEATVDGETTDVTPPDDGWLEFEENILVLDDDEIDCLLELEITRSALTDEYGLEAGNASIEPRE